MIVANSKCRELAQRSTTWVFWKSVVSDRSSSQITWAQGNRAGASALGLRDWRLYSGEIKPKGNGQNSCFSLAETGRAFCTHTRLTEIKFLWRHTSFALHSCASQQGRITWKHAMPKEMPATTLIFDSIVDVTRKKQPCRGGKASTWVQCFSHSLSTTQHLFRAPAAKGKDAPVQAAESFWLPPSCLALAKSFPCQRCQPASQHSSVIKGSAALGLLPTGALG